MISGFMKNLKKINHTSRLASLYPYIRGLPGRGSLLWLSVTIITIAIILVSLKDFSKIWIAAISFYLIIAVNLLFSKIRRGLVNFRRLNGLTTIEMLLNNIGLTINYIFAEFTEFHNIGIAFISSFTALGTLLRGLVVRTLSEDNLGYSIKYCVTVSTLLIIPFLEPALNNLLAPIVIGQFVGNASYIIYSSTVNYFGRVHGLKPIRLLSAMLAIFLEGKKDSLEELAERLDTKSDIRVDCLIFREVGKTKPEISLIVPGFHPGPFRDFGSSILPYLIEDKLSKKGIKTVIMRGLSDHTRNIISRRDCEYVAEEVSKNILTCNSRFSQLSGSTKILKEGSATASLIPVGDSTLVLVTLHPNGMEDIPPEVMNGIDEKNMIIVDSHNSFSQDVKELDGDGFNDIKKVLRHASKIEIERDSELLVGYSQKMLDGYGLEEGIGPLGVRILVFKRDKQFTALVVFDSNNALPRVREEVVKEARSLGIEYCEVLTTDTHIVNGIKLGGRGYHPLGEAIPIEAISSSIVPALKEALANIKKMEVSRITVTFKNLKVMSDSFLEEAAKKTFKSLKFFFLTIISTLIVSAIATILIV